MRPRNIAIVGAGMSGLTAARILQAEGFETRVFEKSRGCGGRMATRRSSGYEFDHGAQFFTARDPGFSDMVKTWVSEGVAERWGGRFATLDGNKVDLHSDEVVRYVGIPRMNSVVRHLANGMAIEFETRIVQLEIAGGRWHLIPDQGTIPGVFEAVILAIPPTQAASILDSTHGIFPQLGEVRMLPCWAVMAAFERPIELPFDAAFVQESPLSWIARNSSKPERQRQECWILHGSPEWSREHIEAGADWVSASLLSSLFDRTGLATREPTWVKAHRWRYALAANPLSEGCLWEPETGLGVCGDWCQGSRVEGAFLSGKVLAERIIEGAGKC